MIQKLWDVLLFLVALAISAGVAQVQTLSANVPQVVDSNGSVIGVADSSCFTGYANPPFALRD